MLANLKVIAFKEALLFLKEKSGLVERVMSNNHQRVVKQFIAYKTRSLKELAKLEAKVGKVIKEEAKLAMEAPVDEASHCLDNKKHPIRLYDCLIPHLNVKETEDKPKVIDIETEDLILDLQMKVNRLTIENSILEKDKELNLSKITQLTNEM